MEKSIHDFAQELYFRNEAATDLVEKDEQKDLLEQWQYCEDRILDDMVEQAFVYGYATAVELREEAIKQYPPKTEDN